MTTAALFMGACAKSESKQDPTLLAFLLQNPSVPTPGQGYCLTAISLVNSCVGGTNTNQYVSPNDYCNNAKFQTEAFAKAVSARVRELNCDQPQSKYTFGSAAIGSTTANGVTTYTGGFSAAFQAANDTI